MPACHQCALSSSRTSRPFGNSSPRRYGLEAVQRAVESRADLILLDIGLPNLNGIEAARQIRELVPESKIIFLTQESSVDVVREARNLGTWGYVVKTNAAHDLLPAMEAVISGKQFFGNT